MSSPINAGLAKRLAEAADTFRDGLYHYFVCRTTITTDIPYDLHYTAGYESDEAAKSAADSLKQDYQLGDDYDKFGPYKTDAPTNEVEPPVEYDSIQLKFMQGNNELYCEEFSDTTNDNGSDVDVIVLSISAYDKFFQPYYVKLYGIEKASELRAAAVSALTSSPRISVLHRGAKSSKPGTGGTRGKAGSYELG